MPVNYKMRAPRAWRFGPWRRRDHNRVAFGWAEPRLQADSLTVLYNPLGAGPQILAVLRLRGNTGEAHILAELGNGAGFVLFQVVKDSLHPGLCSRERSESNAKFAGPCSVPKRERAPGKRGLWQDGKNP